MLICCQLGCVFYKKGQKFGSVFFDSLCIYSRTCIVSSVGLHHLGLSIVTNETVLCQVESKAKGKQKDGKAGISTRLFMSKAVTIMQNKNRTFISR